MDLEETRHFYYAFLANPPHPPPSSSHRHSLPPHMLSGMTLSLISQRKLKPSPQLLTAELLPTPTLPSCCSRRGLPLEWPPAPPGSVETLPPCHLRNHVLLGILSLSCIFHRSISTRSFLPVFTHPQVFSIFISNKQTKTNSHLPQASLSLSSFIE